MRRKILGDRRATSQNAPDHGGLLAAHPTTKAMSLAVRTTATRRNDTRMRSSKSRSRSKNRSRSPMGNIVNRVFDSSGPEGKVRGTPQQIIDKYLQLARDAQLGNDRVAAENFQQHAEHYARMLGEAQREQEARRESQEAQQAQNNQQNHPNQQHNGQRDQGKPAVDAADTPQPDTASAPQPAPTAPGTGDQPDVPTAPATASGDVIDLGGDQPSATDSGLVETPESAPKPRRSRTRSRKPKAATTDKPEEAPTEASTQAPAEAVSDTPEAVSATPEAETETPPAPKPKRTRAKKAPKSDDAPTGDAPPEAPSSTEAAE